MQRGRVRNKHLRQECHYERGTCARNAGRGLCVEPAAQTLLSVRIGGVGFCRWWWWTDCQHRGCADVDDAVGGMSGHDCDRR
jgi:hypothetical protein